VTRRVQVILAATGLAVVVAPLAIRAVRSPRLTPELRGAELAVRMGCFACHGPGATGGVTNPGSKEGEVPAWDGGNAMMYVNNDEEIREWILLGRPRRLAREHSHQRHATPDPSREASHQEGAPGPLLDMPAYEGLLARHEVDDLVSYYKAVANYYDEMPDDARKGYRVARRNACFGCHGPGGRVGMRNPRSFKGYIPPWHGADYRELVKNEAELYQWIREGHIQRFDSNPIARFFTRRQTIKMPAYETRLTEDEIGALVAYVNWLQKAE